ncbi:MAG: VOC family protein [Bauldia sp.]
MARPAARPKARASAALASLDRLHQVAMTATNLDASVAFYRDLLSLRFIARFDPPGLAFFNLGGGTRLLLSATSSSATLYFLVDDLDAAYRHFQARGVHFLQPPAMIHRDEAGQFGRKGNEEWMAFFRDPCGNMLALVERR